MLLLTLLVYLLTGLGLLWLLVFVLPVAWQVARGRPLSSVLRQRVQETTVGKWQEVTPCPPMKEASWRTCHRCHGPTYCSRLHLPKRPSTEEVRMVCLACGSPMRCPTCDQGSSTLQKNLQ